MNNRISAGPDLIVRKTCSKNDPVSAIIWTNLTKNY